MEYCTTPETDWKSERGQMGINKSFLWPQRIFSLILHQRCMLINMRGWSTVKQWGPTIGFSENSNGWKWVQLIYTKDVKGHQLLEEKLHQLQSVLIGAIQSADTYRHKTKPILLDLHGGTSVCPICNIVDKQS